MAWYEVRYYDSSADSRPSRKIRFQAATDDEAKDKARENQQDRHAYFEMEEEYDD